MCSYACNGATAHPRRRRTASTTAWPRPGGRSRRPTPPPASSPSAAPRRRSCASSSTRWSAPTPASPGAPATRSSWPSGRTPRARSSTRRSSGPTTSCSTSRRRARGRANRASSRSGRCGSRRSRPSARFERLVDPGVPIPPAITALTGISPAHVRGRPRIDSVIDEFLRFSAGAVLVAHNARFDVGFVDAELRRLRGGRLAAPVIDTVALGPAPARRPAAAHEPGHAGASRFDTEVRPCHRALRRRRGHGRGARCSCWGWHRSAAPRRSAR